METRGEDCAEAAGKRSHPATTGPGAHLPALAFCSTLWAALCALGSRKVRLRICRAGWQDCRTCERLPVLGFQAHF